MNCNYECSHRVSRQFGASKANVRQTIATLCVVGKVLGEAGKYWLRVSASSVTECTSAHVTLVRRLKWEEEVGYHRLRVRGSLHLKQARKKLKTELLVTVETFMACRFCDVMGWQVWHSTNLRSAHTVYLCVLCGSENKQPLFPYTTLTDWFL